MIYYTCSTVHSHKLMVRIIECRWKDLITAPQNVMLLEMMVTKHVGVVYSLKGKQLRKK